MPDSAAPTPNSTEGQQGLLSQYCEQLAPIGELAAVFLPIVPLPWSGKTEVIYEVLARVRRTDGAVLTPAQFLGEDGLRPEALDHLMLHALVDVLAQHPSKTFSLNIVPQSLCDDAHYSALTAMITQGILDPTRLMLEISESALESPEHETLIIARTQSLRAMGMRLALDEFGSGKEGLKRLANTGYDMVKIPTQFDFASDQERRLGELIVVLLERLSATDAVPRERPLAICFSMTEVEPRFDFARQLRAHYVEGHLFGPPSATLPEPEVLLERISRLAESGTNENTLTPKVPGCEISD